MNSLFNLNFVNICKDKNRADKDGRKKKSKVNIKRSKRKNKMNNLGRFNPGKYCEKIISSDAKWFWMSLYVFIQCDALLQLHFSLLY